MAISSKKFYSLTQFECVDDKLGQGHFGKVTLERFKADGTIYAIKMIRVNEAFKQFKGDNATNKSQSQLTKEYLKEADLMENSIFHPNIIKSYGFFWNSNDPSNELLHLVLEYMDGGNLLEAMQQQKGQFFPQDKIIKWMSQIFSAVRYLHKSIRIIHRDIKPANILMDAGRKICKLADFDLSKSFQETENQHHSLVGTAGYVPPEAFEEKAYTVAFDIWSLGVVLLEVCCLRTTFRAPLDVLGNFDLKIPDIYPVGMSELIKHMLAKDPKQRIDIFAVCRHPLFENEIERHQRKTGELAYEKSYKLELEVEGFKLRFAEINRKLEIQQRQIDAMRGGPCLQNVEADEIMAKIREAVERIEKSGAFLSSFDFLLRVACCESNFGKIIPPSGGVWGLSEDNFKSCFDASEHPFTATSTVPRISKIFNIRLEQVSHSELQNDVFLSALATRVFIGTEPAPIPRNVEEQAVYWNKLFHRDKRDPQEFIACCKQLNQS